MLWRLLILLLIKLVGADRLHRFTYIQEGHKGTLVACVANTGHVLLKIILYKGVTFVHVGIGLVEPFSTMFICSRISNHTQCAEFSTMVLIYSR